MCKALEDLKKEAEEYGREQGLEQGIEQGVSLICALMLKIKEANKEYLMDRVLSDASFRKQVMKEYGLL